MESKARIGIIGSAGLIGNYHVGVLTAGKGPYVLSALCDINEPRLREQVERTGVPGTTRAQDLVRRKDIDAVIVATPHPLHARHVVLVVRAGKDVLCEKPLSHHPGEARRMLKLIHESGRIAGIHYQSRGRPSVMRLKEMIASGQLGRLLNIRVTGSHYKSDYYYALGGWRGTWANEGGGVMINQAPHDIDLMCYLAAENRPEELTARWTNLYHENSQVEDLASAAGRFPNGVEFSLQESVATHGDPSRIEVFGSAGAVTLRGGEFNRYVRYATDLVQFARTYSGPDPYAGPAVQEQPLPELPPFDASLLHHRFAEAVLARDPQRLLVPAEQGIWSMETIAAVYFSGYTGRKVTLPVDAGRYSRMLKDLIAKALPVHRTSTDVAVGTAAKF